MIEFRNVQKTYDTGTKAVKNANFVIELLILELNTGVISYLNQYRNVLKLKLVNKKEDYW